MINAFAQVVFAATYTFAKRIPTASCPFSLNTFQVPSYQNWTVDYVGPLRLCFNLQGEDGFVRTRQEFYHAGTDCIFLSNGHALVCRRLCEQDVRNLCSVISVQCTTRTEIIPSSDCIFLCGATANETGCSAALKASVCRIGPLQCVSVTAIKLKEDYCESYLCATECSNREVANPWIFHRISDSEPPNRVCLPCPRNQQRMGTTSHQPNFIWCEQQR